MNPAHWARGHRLAWLLCVLMGAILGLLGGTLLFPYANGLQIFATFENPTYYWPIVQILLTTSAAGAIFAGVAFYVVELLMARKSN